MLGFAISGATMKTNENRLDALLRTDRMLTLDASLFARDFPELEIVACSDSYQAAGKGRSGTCLTTAQRSLRPVAQVPDLRP
jgi:hypothetical protein